jgi:hypothetical protein
MGLKKIAYLPFLILWAEIGVSEGGSLWQGRVFICPARITV